MNCQEHFPFDEAKLYLSLPLFSNCQHGDTSVSYSQVNFYFEHAKFSGVLDSSKYIFFFLFFSHTVPLTRRTRRGRHKIARYNRVFFFNIILVGVLP